MGSQAKRGKPKSMQKGATTKPMAKNSLEYLKRQMKEHFRFFDNHSPELKKRRKNSHSPGKKTTGSNSKSQKGTRASNLSHSNIFATTDGRKPFIKKRMSQIAQSEDLLRKELVEDEDQRSWLGHDQSFDAIIRSSMIEGVPP